MITDQRAKWMTRRTSIWLSLSANYSARERRGKAVLLMKKCMMSIKTLQTKLSTEILNSSSTVLNRTTWTCLSCLKGKRKWWWRTTCCKKGSQAKHHQGHSQMWSSKFLNRLARPMELGRGPTPDRVELVSWRRKHLHLFRRRSLSLLIRKGSQ